MMPNTQLTRQQVEEIMGRLDDLKLAEILETGASPPELVEAKRWIDGYQRTVPDDMPLRPSVESQIISEKCVLIMTGPIPYDEVLLMNLILVTIKENSVFAYKTELKNLTIYWTGISSHVEYIIQVADVELNASLHDSFNIALLEAMACAIPVVTSNVVGINGHIEKANGGFCFPVKSLRFDELNTVLVSGNSKRHLFDIDFAVDSIAHIAKDRTASRLRAQGAAKYVAEEFVIDRVSKQFQKLLFNNLNV